MKENLALVHYVLRRFRERGEYEDLYQYGCMGLLKAIDRFDPSYGVRFSTYAVPVILGEVRRFLRDDGAVHISRTIHDHTVKVGRFREAYLREHGTEPTLRELADGTGLRDEELMLALNAGRGVRSLNESVDGEGQLRLMDTIGTDCMEAVEKRLLLRQLLLQLSPEERTVIIRRYFRRHTQSEIARDLGLSQVQVSRMEGKILKRMRAGALGG